MMRVCFMDVVLACRTIDRVLQRAGHHGRQGCAPAVAGWAAARAWALRDRARWPGAVTAGSSFDTSGDFRDALPKLPGLGHFLVVDTRRVRARGEHAHPKDAWWRLGRDAERPGRQRASDGENERSPGPVHGVTSPHSPIGSAVCRSAAGRLY